ncbi:hypothetical protein C8R45DRAFT_1207734 [Mycena sanguinolenta]|nr:hypothetical protein C8R45DRAFT_1207734 [Mycena sanguinolenta]
MSLVTQTSPASIADDSFLGAAPTQLVAAQQHVIAHCAPAPGPRVIPHPFRPDARLFVKRGCQSLANEARTQAYLHQHARASPIAPNMAEVYATFSDSRGSTYLVMEYIDALSFRAWIDDCAEEQECAQRTATAVTAIAGAIAWLLTCPLPNVGGAGRIGPRCRLGECVNEALRRRPGHPTDRVSFALEPLIFTHSDITLDNFLWDPSTRRIWLIDCGHISVLPTSFFSFYLHLEYDPLVSPIAAALDFPLSPHLRLLHAAATRIMQGGNSCFGIDKDGNHTWRKPAPSSSRTTDTNTRAALSVT